MTPAETPGARLRATVLALHPGAAMRVAPVRRARCAPPATGSSGTPYVQGSWKSPP